MSEAIADTGPILHLHEIDQLKTLTVFSSLTIPDLVTEELRNYGIDESRFELAGLKSSVVVVEKAKWETVTSEARQNTIQPADAQVYFLAQLSQFQQLVLTDDLTLRRRLETKNSIVVGSVAILVRAYTAQLLERNVLEKAVEALCTTSTLHMSSPFRAYIRHLITNLP